MIFGFQHFHPLRGTPPNEASWIGDDIIFRARSIIQRRNLKQIKTAIGIVNWLIDHSPAREATWDELMKEAEYLSKHSNSTSTQNVGKHSNPFDRPRRDLSSAVTSLQMCIDRYDLSNYPQIPNLSWPELFAVLALSLIDKAVSDEQYYRSLKKQEGLDFFYEYRITAHVMIWLPMAMDAVVQAEGLSKYEATSENVEVLIKKKISLQNKQAGIQRHAKTDEAAIALLDYYRDGQFKSFRKCVHRFIEQNPKLVDHLTETNRTRTLAERLSKMMKQPGSR